MITGRRVGLEGAGGPRDDLPLVLALRVIHLHEENEAVLLRLGQRISPFLLDGVLRGEHEERLLELQRVAADGDGVLLHRLEQRRLRLRRGAVDFVRQDHLRKDRPLLEDELAPCPVAGSSWMISVPVMSAGIRSGVNWMRRKLRSMQCASERIIAVFARPGTPSSRQWPPASTAITSCSMTSLLADDELRHFLGDFAVRLHQPGGGGLVVGLGFRRGRALRGGRREYR